MIATPPAGSRTPSLAPGLLRITWILTATVLAGMIGLPFLGALNSALGNTELLRLFSLPFGMLWMLLFALSKVVSATLLVFAIAVAVTPGVESKTRILTASAGFLVAAWLFISSLTAHF